MANTPPPQVTKPGTTGTATDKRTKKNRSDGTPAPYTPPPTTTPPVPYTNPPSTPVAQPYGDIAKTLLPYLSPEDSASLSTFYGFDPTNEPIPTSVTGSLRNYYLSKGRAGAALGALENMKAASGKSDLGPGYTFLTNAIGLLNQFGALGGDEGMNRQSYAQFSTAMNNLLQLAGTDKELTPYANLASLFASPNFTAGPLVSQIKSGNRTLFGSPNSQLYN